MASTESGSEDNSHPTLLSPSELGTKDYWETFYARTLAHISTKHSPAKSTTATLQTQQAQETQKEEEEDVSDDDDPGTSWFSEHKAPEKVLRFLTAKSFPLAPRNTQRSQKHSRVQKKNKDKKGSKDVGDGEKEQPSILDLGTGNGSMLALLRKRGGFTGPMVGVDYSGRSIELARELQRLRMHSAYLSDSDSELSSEDEDESEGGYYSGDGTGEHEDVVAATGTSTNEAIPVPSSTEENKNKSTNIRFEEWDILSPIPHALSTQDLLNAPNPTEAKLDWFPYDKGGFDIVLDKGTFDAVSLSDEVVVEEGQEKEKEKGKGEKVIQKRVCERYPLIARRLVRKGGFLVVTSCNWTEEELVRWFTSSSSPSSGGHDGDNGDNGDDGLKVWGRVEYPRFRFGGREGQGVCTVCFQRV